MPSYRFDQVGVERIVLDPEISGHQHRGRESRGFAVAELLTGVFVIGTSQDTNASHALVGKILPSLAIRIDRAVAPEFDPVPLDQSPFF